MSNERDEKDELEALLAEVASTPEQRAEIVEAHRLLEKDLSRLADPLPPADFVQKVMLRVEVAEAAGPSRSDRRAAALVLVGSLGGAVAAAASSGSLSGGVGSRLAQMVVLSRQLGVAAVTAGSAIWNTAALPLSMVVVGCMAAGLWVFRRRAAASARVR